MKSIAILPARMGSSRFPGKPLCQIAGIPMIGHCYYRTKLSKKIDDVYVATCDKEIDDYMKSINGKCVMTSSHHTRATGRTSEALDLIAEKTGENYDVIIMVQGDEPLVLPETIDKAVDEFKKDPSLNIVNIVSELTTKEEFEDVNNVKVVFDKNMYALYMSRQAIPSPWKGLVEGHPMYMQMGVIGFREKTLADFNKSSELPLEQIESVDMNRILEQGEKIKIVKSGMRTIGVDTPEEAAEAGKILENDAIYKEYSK